MDGEVLLCCESYVPVNGLLGFGVSVFGAEEGQEVCTREDERTEILQDPPSRALF